MPVRTRSPAPNAKDIPLADVAQLARVPPCHGGCCGFESHHPLQLNIETLLPKGWSVFTFHRRSGLTERKFFLKVQPIFIMLFQHSMKDQNPLSFIGRIRKMTILLSAVILTAVTSHASWTAFTPSDYAQDASHPGGSQVLTSSAWNRLIDNVLDLNSRIG